MKIIPIVVSNVWASHILDTMAAVTALIGDCRCSNHILLDLSKRIHCSECVTELLLHSDLKILCNFRSLKLLDSTDISVYNLLHSCPFEFSFLKTSFVCHSCA
jgi:hypothetical protein